MDELGRNAARALMSYHAATFPLAAFDGAGVYTLHYVGEFPAYAGMHDSDPIYVGRANPPGGRQGRQAAAKPNRALHERLSKHARSIEAVENLDLEDFRCRWLVLDPVWIGLTEQVMIAEAEPLWNVVVSGFGINAPGWGRGQQARSQWDTVHPGRPEVSHLPNREEGAADILATISAHRGNRNDR